MALVMTGDAGLRRLFADLKGKDGKAAFRKGCRAGAKIVAARLRTDVPGGMKRAAQIKALKRRRGRVGVRVSLDYRNAKGEPVGWFLEGGTRVHPGKRIRRVLSGRYARSEVSRKKNAAYEALEYRIKPRLYAHKAAAQTGMAAIAAAQKTMVAEIERRAARR